MAEESRTDALVERLFESTVGALELMAVYLGAELGLYRALDESGAMTAGELAEAASIDERYAREWLEQQAVAGFLAVNDGAADAGQRRFRLDEEHAGPLARAGDSAHVAPFGHLLTGVAQALPKVVQAYRDGSGVPYSEYGRDFRCGQGGINRPVFTEELPTAWMDAMPDVRDRVAAGGRVADVGCGLGWSTIALAKRFESARIDGVDLDPASVADAARNAEAAGVNGDRVRFIEGDAASLSEHGTYDLALVLESLHDMARPVEALSGMREALADDGVLLVVDERVADEFTAPGDPVERIMYGWSVVHCLPVGREEQPSAATGTVMRASTLRRYAESAGFGTVEVLPVENDFFRLYRLDR
ncbi:MAG: class I SAM-dependent methyltransferase [Actinomycetota bacterium]|nr:class I SAM-dependent methyltransferase [Actinomycetota bacterium]